MVLWRRDAFAAGGVPAPAPDWTLADFERTCALLQQVVDSGKVAGLKSVLPPMVGPVAAGPAPKGQLYWATALWAGFALGFGGTLVREGRFHLTDTATLNGLAKLVGLVRQFGGSPDLPPRTQAEQNALWQTFPFALNPVGTFNVTPLWVTKPTQDLRAAFAPFPRLPVRPVIPVEITGTGLAYRPSSKAPHKGMSKDDLALAAQFLLWLYGPQQQRLLADYDLPPVLADAAAQDAFWAAPPDGVQPGQDWRRFVDYAAGWPGLPPPEIMYNDLAGAVAEPGTLEAELARAETAMNTWADGAAQLASKLPAQAPV